MLLKMLACGMAVALLAGPAAAALEETRSFSSEQLTVRNLIGEVRVEASSGSDFEVIVKIEGQDARDGMIELNATDNELDIRFPSGVRDYVYPRAGGNTDIDDDDGGWISDLVGSVIGRGRINVRQSGQGTELWVDLIVRVPSGAELEVEHGVGAVIAEGVDGDLELSTRSGDVKIDGSQGSLSVATGNGDVAVERTSGDEVQIATGSGDVQAADTDSEEVQVATGSGDIKLESTRGRSVQLATGSGDIEASAVSADNVEIGTGSGTVALELDQMSNGSYSVGTGSGDIAVTMPAGASADVHAETDRGRIIVDLSGDVDYRRQEPDEVRLTVGGGGASVDLGTGSGDIRIRD